MQMDALSVDRIRRVVKVEVASPTSDSLGIKERLALYGGIHGFYPYKSGKADESHYFVEFKDDITVDIVLKLSTPQTHFYSLAVNPGFRDQFQSAILALDRERLCKQIAEIPVISDSNTLTRNTDPHSHLTGTLTLPAVQGQSKGDKIGDFQVLSRFEPEPMVSQPNDQHTFKPTGGLVQEQCYGINQPTYPLCVAPLLTSPMAPLELTDQGHNLPSTSQILLHLAPVGLPFSLEKEVVLSVCGRVITYSLASLDDDPRTIIGLLKLASSERCNWMMVGAYYRRKKNPAAALAVMTAMIEVMKEHKVGEGDLKPAFLMLSGCETDLMKMTRSADDTHTLVSEEHYRRSQGWLQKVYGKFTPAPAMARNPSTSVHLDEAARYKPDDTILNSASRPDRIQSLEREIQHLRDHQRRQDTLLHQSTASQCKLEDDLARLHVRRRKLERQVDNLQDRLHMAQKSESHMKEQLQREINLRKCAEETAIAERARRRELGGYDTGENAVPKASFNGLGATAYRIGPNGPPLVRSDENLHPRS